MSLLAPLLLIGLLGLALPVIAHLQGREEPQTLRFGAVRFIEATEQIVTRRRGLQDLLLLILRLLLLALLVLALTRPASVGQSDIAVVAEPHDAVLLVDGSRSMGVVVDGEPRLAHAVEQAQAVLGALPPGTRIGLLTTDPNGPVLEPAAERERVELALQGWAEQNPAPGAWVMSASLPRAVALLEASGERRKRVIYAVGDATKRGLGSLPPLVGEDIIVIAVRAGNDVAPEHVSVDFVAWEPAPEIDPRAIRIVANVLRHVAGPTDAEARDVGVALMIGSDEVARATVEVLPNEVTVIEFTHQLLGQDAVTPAALALTDESGDPLPSDDVRHLWLSADDALEVAIVNGDPNELRAHDEVFFLSTALASSESASHVRVSSLAPDQLEQRVREQGHRALADVDVLILGNVRAPTEDVTPTIIERVREGMGLWIATGSQVEAVPYNDRLGEVLPLLLREPVVVGTAPGRTEARAEGLAPANLSHPAFRGLSGDLGLAGGRARRVFLLEPDPNREHEIAVAFASGAPALVTREVGRGRVALLTTTIDRDWADLPLRPGFVPLVDRTVTYLGGDRSGGAAKALLVGEPRVFRSDGPLTIRTPAGREVSVAPDDDGVATFTETWEVGHYRLGEEAMANGLRPFSVVVDPVEGMTDAIELPAPDLDGEGAEVSVITPRWRSLVLLALIVLALESALRWRRGRT